MKFFVYESPKKERKRSAPVAESDTITRTRLEAMGWHVVEKWDDAAVTDEAVIPTVVTEDALDFLTDEQRAALAEAGFGDEAALRAATDDQLRDVLGIGPATVRNLRAALAQPE